jgi:tetratricopeptide (TPR) repeat protein
LRAPANIGLAAALLIFAASACACVPAFAQREAEVDINRQLKAAHRLQVVGRYGDAVELYKKLYAEYPDREAVIREYGEALLMNKEYGAAEALYLEIRERKNKPLAYSVQLERVHKKQGRYRDAAMDCMDVIAENRGRIEWVRGEVIKLAELAEDGADMVLGVIADRMAAAPKVGEYRMLAVELLARASRPAEAAELLEEIRAAELLSAENLRSLGIHLEAFGEIDLAALSFELALDRQGNIAGISDAAFKLANIYANTGRADESRAVLKNLESRYPTSAIAFKAKLGMATLEAERLGRPERALVLYEELLEQKNFPVDPTVVKEAIAKCLIRTGRLSEARETYSEIAGDPSKVSPEAHFMAAEMSFFMGETDSALALYGTLASNHPEWELANDAIDRAFLLQEHEGQTDNRPLGLYAMGELLATIGKPDSALGYFSLLVTDFSESPLVDDALLRSAELYLIVGDVDMALSACSAVAQDHPDSRRAPLAREMIGDIWWEEKGDAARALDEYMKGLDEFPDSLVAPRVRDKVAQLRREAG